MPSPFGPADHLAEGKLLYKRADFQNALDAFNSALQFAPHDLVLLDCRAATREKLGNLDEALRDAKSMIRISRADGRGYLRAGKLLSIMAKTDAALSIYDYGLRQVPDTDPTHEALRRMKNKTANATKGRDPLEVLPVELAENIMRCLPFRDVVRCLRVSKGWHRFIASRSCLWESLDLSQARKNVHTAFLMSCFANSKGRLIDASIQQLSQPALVYLVKYCPRSHLTYLRITSQMSEVYVVKTVCQAPNLKDLFVAGQVEFLFSDLVSILSACPNLAKVCCHIGPEKNLMLWTKNYPNLRALEISTSSPQALELFLGGLLVHAPSIVRLSLKGWTTCSPNFEFTRLASLMFLRFECYAPVPRLLPPSLRFLHLPRTTPHVHGPFGGQILPPVDAPPATLPLLEEISWVPGGLNSVQQLCDLLLQQPLDLGDNDVSGIKKLTIEGFEEIKNFERLLSVPRLATLEQFYWRGLRVRDEDRTLILDTFKNLRRLDLSASKITGVTIRELVTVLQLEYLNVDYCYHVSPDAIEWARRQGVEVSYKFEERRKGGRKVRYGT